MGVCLLYFLFDFLLDKYKIPMREHVVELTPSSLLIN